MAKLVIQPHDRSIFLLLARGFTDDEIQEQLNIKKGILSSALSRLKAQLRSVVSLGTRLSRPRLALEIVRRVATDDERAALANEAAAHIKRLIDMELFDDHGRQIIQHLGQVETFHLTNAELAGSAGYRDVRTFTDHMETLAMPLGGGRTRLHMAAYFWLQQKDAAS